MVCVLYTVYLFVFVFYAQCTHVLNCLDLFVDYLELSI